MTSNALTIRSNDIEAISKAMLLAKDLSDSEDIKAGFEAWERLRLMMLRARVRLLKENPDRVEAVSFVLHAQPEEPTT